ncbi:hypothetical protein DL93DRAFT_1982463 [Clavulina sp. PMI_390]|nr:hypothetical protein DL93DRAFT_1982463 [Clavulina sp. PMI_390]
MRAPAALRSLVSSSSSKKSKDAAAVPNSPSVPAHPRPEKSSGQSMPPLGAPLLPPSAFVGLLDNDDGSNFYPTPTSPRTETTMQDDYFRAENPFARSERARAGSLASSVGRGAAGPQSDTHAPPHSFAYEARASSPQLQASSEGHGDGGPSTRRVPSSPTPTSQQHFSGNTSSYSYPARGGTPVNNYPSSAATNPAATAPITSSASQPMAPSTSSSSRPRGRSFTSAAKKLFSRSKSRDREPSSDQNHSLSRSRSRSRASSGENDEFAAGNEDIPAVPPLPFQLSHQFNEERSSIRSRAGSGSTNAHGTSSVGGAHGAAEKFSFPPLGSPSLGRGSEDPFGAAFGSGSGSGNVTPTPPRPGTAGSGSTRSRAITAPSKYTPGSLSAALALTGEPDVDGVDPDHVEQIQQSNNPFMVPRALVLGHGSPSTPKQPPPPVPTASAHISAPTASQQGEAARSMSAPNTVESTMMMIESDSEAFVPPPPPVPSNAVDAPSSSVVPESAVASGETGADFTLSLGISPVAGLDDSDVDTLALPPVPSLPPTPSVSTSFQGAAEAEAEVPEEPVTSNAETPLVDVETAVLAPILSPSSPPSLESEAEAAEEQQVEGTGAVESVVEPEAGVAAIVPPPALESSALVEPQDVVESEERIPLDTATALAASKPPTPTIEVEDVDVNLAAPTSEEDPHVDFTPAISCNQRWTLALILTRRQTTRMMRAKMSLWTRCRALVGTSSLLEVIFSSGMTATIARMRTRMRWTMTLRSFLPLPSMMRCKGVLHIRRASRHIRMALLWAGSGL